MAATERRILSAARELFVSQGYTDTTLAAVARRAGVGARTVYLRFGSKGAVLLRAVDLALEGYGTGGLRGSGRVDGGSPSADPIADYARRSRVRFEGMGGLVGVLAQAGATEPFVAAAVDEAGSANRRAAAALVVAVTVVRAGSRVDRVGSDSAADERAETVAVLGSAATWLQLTEVAGWSPDRYQRWLADTIGALLAT